MPLTVPLMRGSLVGLILLTPFLLAEKFTRQSISKYLKKSFSGVFSRDTRSLLNCAI